MTREEAIERLNIHKSTSVFVDSIAEAIDMAIEALQGGDAETSPIPNGTGVMQQSRHNDGRIEVVRCKDCRQYIPHDLTDDRGWCCGYKTLIEEDDYCSHGERREE